MFLWLQVFGWMAFGKQKDSQGPMAEYLLRVGYAVIAKHAI